MAGKKTAGNAEKKPAKPKVRATPRKRRGAAIESKLGRSSTALKKQFEKVKKDIAKLRAEGSAAFDALYETIGEVLEGEPPLYLGGGYRTAQDFIAGELPGESLRSVQRNVLVARCFSPEDEARHGITFLEEVALYAKELTGAEAPPPAIDLDRLKLALRGKDGKTARKVAREATIDDVRKARRLMRKGATKSKANPAEGALRAALGKSPALAPIAVRANAKTASFGGVPLALLAAFGKAVAQAKLPER